MGLYFNFSMVLFYIPVIAIYLIYKIIRKKQKKEFKLFSFKRYFRYVKLFLNSKTIIFIMIISILSNMQVLIQNKKYEHLYQEGEVNLEAVIVDNKTEKEYKNQYKIKVISNNKYKNTYLYLKTNKSTELEYGDKINVTGKFTKPDIARNYGGFDYKEYLKTVKVHGILNVEDIKVTDKNQVNFIFTLANKTKLEVEGHIDLCLEKEQAELLKGILLGDTSNIDEELKENFRNANISHILAVSRIACFIYCNGN